MGGDGRATEAHPSPAHGPSPHHTAVEVLRARYRLRPMRVGVFNEGDRRMYEERQREV